MKDFLVAFLLQFIPKLVGPKHERNMGRILKVRLPNDSRSTM